MAEKKAAKKATKTAAMPAPYGMPGYAKDGKTVCFFRADKKYMTFAFTQEANLTREEGAPVSEIVLDGRTAPSLSAEQAAEKLCFVSGHDCAVND
jgi:hypothetical protein